MKADQNRRVAVLATSGFLFLYFSCCVAVVLHEKLKRQRRFGVRPMNRKRNSEGLFATLIRDMLKLEWDEEQFHKYSRMSKRQFLNLHKLVAPYLQKDKKRLHIAPAQRLIMTLQ